MFKKSYRDPAMLIFLVLLFIVMNVNFCANINAQQYHKVFRIFPQVAFGFNEYLEFESTLQIRNNSYDIWEGRYALYETGMKPWISSYIVNDTPKKGYNAAIFYIEPWGTITFTFLGSGGRDTKIRSGYMQVSGIGGRDRLDEVSMSFFFTIKDRKTGELIDSVGVGPSDHGWVFHTPVKLSKTTQMGVAIVYLSKAQRTQFVYELWDNMGYRIASKYEILEYESNVPIYPYHKARFISEIFPDADIPEDFEGSFVVYAQRNINVMVLRMDTLSNGGIQLTSLPITGILCDDEVEPCFEER